MFTKDYTLDRVIRNGEWTVPAVFIQRYHDLWLLIREVPFAENDEDQLVWTGSTNGYLTIKDAYGFYRDKSNTVAWLRRIWSRFIPPKLCVWMENF